MHPPLNAPPAAHPQRLLTLLLLAVVSLILIACQPPRRPQRELFDEAEIAYRSGNYDLAIEHYEAFRKAFPDHTLAPLAQQRISNIEREVNSVMQRKIGTKPIYLRPVDLNETTEVSGGVVHALPPTPTNPPPPK